VLALQGGAKAPSGQSLVQPAFAAFAKVFHYEIKLPGPCRKINTWNNSKSQFALQAESRSSREYYPGPDWTQAQMKPQNSTNIVSLAT
jgi:hypothetical protein